MSQRYRYKRVAQESDAEPPAPDPGFLPVGTAMAVLCVLSAVFAISIALLARANTTIRHLQKGEDAHASYDTHSSGAPPVAYVRDHERWILRELLPVLHKAGVAPAAATTGHIRGASVLAAASYEMGSSNDTISECTPGATKCTVVSATAIRLPSSEYTLRSDAHQVVQKYFWTPPWNRTALMLSRLVNETPDEDVAVGVHTDSLGHPTHPLLGASTFGDADESLGYASKGFAVFSRNKPTDNPGSGLDWCQVGHGSDGTLLWKQEPSALQCGNQAGVYSISADKAVQFQVQFGGKTL